MRDVSLWRGVTYYLAGVLGHEAGPTVATDPGPYPGHVLAMLLAATLRTALFNRVSDPPPTLAA